MNKQRITEVWLSQLTCKFSWMLAFPMFPTDFPFGDIKNFTITDGFLQKVLVLTAVFLLCPFLSSPFQYGGRE
jgi:hypothetical protein